LIKKSFVEEYPSIVADWDYKNNGEKTPENYTKGSGVEASWKNECGHEYERAIRLQIKAKGRCPICNNRRFFKNINDLKTLCPDIAIEWDNKKNGNKKSEEYKVSSNENIWWKCKKGHSFQTKIISRTAYHTGCPICSGNKVMKNINDLASLRKDVAIEWDYEKNKEKKPENYTVSSEKKVWWICKNGHSYETRISHRTSDGSKCPYCMGNKPIKGETDLLSQRPETLKDWDYENNQGKKPENYTRHSTKKIWWICENGHRYEATIENHVNGRKCPYCVGRKPEKGKNDLKTLCPKIAEEWDCKENGNKNPEEYTVSSGKKVWWKCEKNHKYRAAIYNRTKGRHNCPYCAGRKKYRTND